MSAPPRKIHVTPEVVARFRDYHSRHSTWGAFHVVLDDGNFDLEPQESDPWTAEERELATMLADMTQTQRAKIARLA